MKIVGIDPSLTAPGFAVIVRKLDGTAFAACDTLKTSKPPRGGLTEDFRQSRVDEIVMRAASWVTHAALVVLEGISFDSHDTSRQLAGLHWVLRRELWTRGLPVVVVPPSTLKKFAGVGPLGKADMLAAARATFGLEVVDDNSADALWLAEVGATYLGCPVRSDSPERLRLTNGIVWPDRDIAA